MTEVDLDEVLAAQRTQFIAAKLLMEERKDRKGVLIYLGNQHPLEVGADGRRDQPGRELSARCEKAVELLDRFKHRGFHVQIIVSGGRHEHNGIWDDIPVRDAAVKALKANGATDDDIVSGEVLGDLMRQTGLSVIGNGQDEVKVATTLFKVDKRFGYMYAVGGHVQLARMMEVCMVNGVLAIGATPEVFQENGWPLPASEHHHTIDFEVVATVRQANRLTSIRANAEVTAADAQFRESRTAADPTTRDIIEDVG